MGAVHVPLADWSCGRMPGGTAVLAQEDHMTCDSVLGAPAVHH